MIKKLHTRNLERIVRGFSCHRRIQMLELLVHSNEAMSLRDIGLACRINFRTAGEHTRRLILSNLVEKRKRGREVLHEPTLLGVKVLSFLQSLGTTQR